MSRQTKEKLTEMSAEKEELMTERGEADSIIDAE